MEKFRVSFNRPFAIGTEFEYIQQAIADLHLSGNGRFSKQCHTWLENELGSAKALITHSCTAALEMCAILADIQPGDEVIMPAYTFVSTANAFVLRGGVPVFVDIREDTLNLDETQVEAAITPRTKALVPVHYAGVGCEMDALSEISRQHQLFLIEDAAQAMSATYKGRPLGNFGNLAALSFHETKNVISGEGGALLINDAQFSERAEIIWEKGTNRSQFFRGEVDKYTWVDIGSSYLPSEIIAAFLWAQLEKADDIARMRLDIWHQYHQAFADLEKREVIRRPIIPAECHHNAHMYYLLVKDLTQRTKVLKKLREVGIQAVFHYVPLHTAPAGQKFGRASGPLSNTITLSERLVRLPLWTHMTAEQVTSVVEAVYDILQL